MAWPGVRARRARAPSRRWKRGVEAGRSRSRTRAVSVANARRSQKPAPKCPAMSAGPRLPSTMPRAKTSSVSTITRARALGSQFCDEAIDRAGEAFQIARAAAAARCRSCRSHDRGGDLSIVVSGPDVGTAFGARPAPVAGHPARGAVPASADRSVHHASPKVAAEGADPTSRGPGAMAGVTDVGTNRPFRNRARPSSAAIKPDGDDADLGANDDEEAVIADGGDHQPRAHGPDRRAGPVEDQQPARGVNVLMGFHLVVHVGRDDAVGRHDQGTEPEGEPELRHAGDVRRLGHDREEGGKQRRRRSQQRTTTTRRSIRSDRRPSGQVKRNAPRLAVAMKPATSRTDMPDLTAKKGPRPKKAPALMPVRGAAITPKGVRPRRGRAIPALRRRAPRAGRRRHAREGDGHGQQEMMTETRQKRTYPEASANGRRNCPSTPASSPVMP